MKTLIVLIGILGANLAQANWFVYQHGLCLPTAIVGTVGQASKQAAFAMEGSPSVVRKDSFAIYYLISDKGFTEQKIAIFFKTEALCRRF